MTLFGGKRKTFDFNSPKRFFDPVRIGVLRETTSLLGHSRSKEILK